MAPRQPLEALLGALVHVEQPKLEVQHGLAGDAEPEMPGLDDAGVHGSHRHLEHALAGDRPERMRRGHELPEVTGKSLDGTSPADMKYDAYQASRRRRSPDAPKKKVASARGSAACASSTAA